MTTAISTGSEAPHSSSPRGQAYVPVSRSQSTRSRPANNNGGVGNPPTRAASQHHHNAPHHGPVQDVLPHRDYETTNVAQTQKRASPKDLPAPPTDSSSRPQRRSSQRSAAPLPPPTAATADMTPATVANNAGPALVAPGAAAASAARQSRSRTTIPTQSGKWILGKTIGAGSMGKVKLARKEDSNEQVS